MTAPARYRFGFDIGGTFTDFVLCDMQSGDLRTYKTLTTPDSPARAVVEGWHALLAMVGATGQQVELSIHGTTLITNALIERKGAVTAVVTTEGFADTLDTQREMRYDIYDLHSPPVSSLVPRKLRTEVRERLNAFGEVVTELDVAGLDAVAEFVRQYGPQAVAVCLLHAYRNGMHEQQVADYLRKTFPDLAVSISSDVCPEIREYERMSTTVANAYVQPLASRYLVSLEQELQSLGYPRDLYLMLSSGGITVADTAARFPIRLVESGPAAGALAAIFFGGVTGHSDLVSFDMGGTTAKLCVIAKGRAQMTHTFEIARMHRFKKGSGLPVRIPAIELIEIGAGGGSIARIDELGLLKVGPHSAGAMPGPACYGRGGSEPTVTDANLLLGFLNPGYFLGGRMTLDLEAARAAMQPLADKLKRSVVEAAYGIYRVVNESMISAMRVHVAERGVDPRVIMLMAFGGAGPAHADALARALKMRGYIIPTNAGVASALGFLTAPTAFDLARTCASSVTEERLRDLESVVADLEAEGRSTLRRAGVRDEEMRFTLSMDLRHIGQGHEVTVLLPPGRLSELGLNGVRETFFAQYEAIYGYAHRHLSLEVMTLRMTADGGRPELRLAGLDHDPSSAARALKGSRPIFVAAWERSADVPVYDRYLLRGSAVLHGPCVVEEHDSTAIFGPDVTIHIDSYQNLIATFDLHQLPDETPA
jgi:N-methylhydantoinase A/oxoprolinase/acetone carboxylase beta subunit